MSKKDEIDYQPIEDWISTYPETQKVIEDIAEKIQPLKEYLKKIKLPSGIPLVSSILLDSNRVPNELYVGIVFNDGAVKEEKTL